jgi:hypothetical protein
MASPRFLFDEDVRRGLAAALRGREPTIDIVSVGGPGAPPKKTLDPDLLIAAEGLHRLLVTRDRKTMRGHVAAHCANGRHTYGLLQVRRSCSWSTLIDDLLLVAQATDADEWIDTMLHIPF